jgi:hypothetical protein
MYCSLRQRRISSTTYESETAVQAIVIRSAMAFREYDLVENS